MVKSGGGQRESERAVGVVIGVQRNASGEGTGAKSVLRAAALTYVAAALASIAVLLYYLQAFSSR